ncbi:MAG: 50S ribosomal protein L29, partial [Candidatus Marsarchaeota archaeon]|nr:50S ribosomal protein L29 [Candidatus Marsarchaeota archaeon]
IKIKDIKSNDNNNLVSKLNDLELELSKERQKIKSTGVASKVVKSKEIRKTIARIKTILSQRGVNI